MDIDDVLGFKYCDRQLEQSDSGLTAVTIVFRDEYRTYTDCGYGHCLSDSGFCRCYVGLSSTGDVVFCSRDNTEAE